MGALGAHKNITHSTNSAYGDSVGALRKMLKEFRNQPKSKQNQRNMKLKRQ
jgi:hypothetical protein